MHVNIFNRNTSEVTYKRFFIQGYISNISLGGRREEERVKEEKVKQSKCLQALTPSDTVNRVYFLTQSKKL